MTRAATQANTGGREREGGGGARHAIWGELPDMRAPLIIVTALLAAAPLAAAVLPHLKNLKRVMDSPAMPIDLSQYIGQTVMVVAVRKCAP